MIVEILIGVGTLIAGLSGGYWLGKGNGDNVEKQVNTKANNINAEGVINNVIIKDVQDTVEIVNKEMLTILYMYNLWNKSYRISDFLI